MDKGNNDFTGRLFLIRHGETQLNEDDILIGYSHLGLSDLGQLQGRKVAKELSDWDLKDPLLLSSNLRRAKETAEIIRDNIYIGGLDTGLNLKIIEDSAFGELNLGSWKGQFTSETKGERLEAFEKQGLDLFSYQKDYQGENFYDLQYRVVEKLNEYMKKYPSRDLILVAHSLGIRIILCTLLGIALEEMNNFFVPKASLNIISF